MRGQWEILQNHLAECFQVYDEYCSYLLSTDHLGQRKTASHVYELGPQDFHQNYADTNWCDSL